jgi:hypothetical protein
LSREQIVNFFEAAGIPVEIGAHGTVLQMSKFPKHSIYALEYNGDYGWWRFSKEKFDEICRENTGMKYVAFIDSGVALYIMSEKSVAKAIEDNGNSTDFNTKSVEDKTYVKKCTTLIDLKNWLQL